MCNIKFQELESHKNGIFRVGIYFPIYIFFELWSVLKSKFLEICKISPKDFFVPPKVPIFKWKMCNVLPRMKNPIFRFFFSIMVDVILKIHRSFSVFWPSIQPKMSNICSSKRCKMFWNQCRTQFQIFGIGSFWDIVYFVLGIPSQLGT